MADVLSNRLNVAQEEAADMNLKAQVASAISSPNPARRRLLGGMLSAYTITLIPWAIAQPVTDTDQGAFLALSAILVGRPSLDTVQAQRLYSALVDDAPGFPADARALLALINEQHIDPLELQKTLDIDYVNLAATPRKIVLAWYVGVVGKGEQARCLAYETSLMQDAVKDRLRPPTYAYGVYGSWTAAPNQGAPDA